MLDEGKFLEVAPSCLFAGRKKPKERRKKNLESFSLLIIKKKLKFPYTITMASWLVEHFGENILTKEGLKPTAEAITDKKCKKKIH